MRWKCSNSHFHTVDAAVKATTHHSCNLTWKTFLDPMLVGLVDLIIFLHLIQLWEYMLQVQKAIAYAREAHTGQMRKTGEPYITHCVHTARILAALVPAHGKRVCCFVWFFWNPCSGMCGGLLNFLSTARWLTLFSVLDHFMSTVDPKIVWEWNGFWDAMFCAWAMSIG